MRKILIMILAMVMIFSLAACSNDMVSSREEETTKKHTTKGDTIEEITTEETQAESKHIDEDSSFDGLEEIVLLDVETAIDALCEEYDALLVSVDTYEKYLENVEMVEGFYEKVHSETGNICIRLREYCVEYANIILASDKSFADRRNDFDEIYDCIYEDATDEIYDEIYNGILDDIYDDLYSGLLDEAYGDAEYEEWSEARSNEYEWWSDTRSEVYDEWSDCRSDIYDFWSDMKGEMWDEDIEKAYEKVTDFIEDIEQIKEKEADVGNGSVSETEITNNENSNEGTTEADVTLVEGMRPEFKEAMDSYEEFYENYCEVMKAYSNNPTDLSILTEYAELMQKSVEMSEKFEAWDEEEMNNAELMYYLDVNGRVTQMLLEVYE